MKPIRYFVVKVPKTVKDTIKVGDQEMYLDTRFNEFENRAMEGEVVGTPLKFNTGVEEGDTLYFHHHVILGGAHLTMKEKGLNENKERGQYLGGYKDLYYVMYDGGDDPFFCQAYAHKSKRTGDVRLLGEWIFLTPAEQEPELKSSIIELMPQKKPEFNQFGYVRYGSKKLEELGLHEGDKVFFMKNADYVMEINGEKLYRVYLQHIYAKVHEEV
jgi:co-chaperonin GroES (HSP10)